MSTTKKTRVLVVDDSAVVRRMISEALSQDPELEVVGTASDPYIARDMILELNPDVLTLDIEMPRMDGLTFLKILQEHRPMPVVIVSSLTQAGSKIAMRAMELGAVDVVAKQSSAWNIGALRDTLAQRVKGAARARLSLLRPTSEASGPAESLAGVHFSPRQLIVMGASTGGTEALKSVLTRLPAGLPGICIVQHIPPVFSKTFAERLNELCAFKVREAVDGEPLQPGLALIAPGNFHLLVQWQWDHYRARVVSGPAVWHQRPSVDLLFKSAADSGAAAHIVAGVLTGMGRDGAAGLLAMRRAGAVTIAQDESTSVVYGMPRVAWENGGAQRQIPLDRIADFIVHPTHPIHDSTGALAHA